MSSGTNLKKNDEIQRIILNVDNLSEVYRILDRSSKKQKYEDIIQIVLKRSKHPPEPLIPFYEELLEKLHDFQALPSIIDLNSKEETEAALLGLHALLRNKDEIARRNWSIRLYNDSKKWESIEGKILNVLYKYVYNENEEILEEESVLELHGIIKNPRHVQVAGNIIISIDDSTIDLSNFSPDIGLNPGFFAKCKILDVDADAVVTIENLTSYYDYLSHQTEGRKEIVLYLGGYHNEGRRVILNKLQKFFLGKKKTIPFYHWSDIDLYGIHIWNHLRTKTGIDFQPIYMDETTYLKYLDKGKPLLEKDKKRLKALLNKENYSPFHSLIENMLKYDKIIEQEAITL